MREDIEEEEGEQRVHFSFNSPRLKQDGALQVSSGEQNAFIAKRRRLSLGLRE